MSRRHQTVPLHTPPGGRPAMNERKKRERVLEALQAQRGLRPAEVTELLDLHEGRAAKNLSWDVQVGRLAFNGIDVDERIAAQKRDEA